ncbi:hypothetical protein C8R44DRAFT_887662 [Mycena epipterygia]|nr:hypothetical protein C8R44DRAFT_887662 [Mycena epipterygia]
MACFAALFFAVVAATTSVTAATIQERDSALATLFTDINFGGEAFTVIGTVPTGCIAAIPPFVSSVSSVKIATGVKCTLWNETECGRAPGNSITLAADTPDLVKLQFNDLPPTSASPTIESTATSRTQPLLASCSRQPSVPHSLLTRSGAKGIQARSSNRLAPSADAFQPFIAGISPASPSRSPTRSPTPPTRRTVLSSDSDSSPPRPTTTHSAMSSQSKLATVEIRTGKLPTVHPGEITPLVATQFEHGMLDYAAAKDVAADKITALVFGCFLDQRVRNWFSPSGVREAFSKLTLADFMAKLRKKFLRPDWEIQTRASILSSRMKDTETFSDWVVVLQSLQALLIGTTHAVDDTRLRHTLEANMVADLACRLLKGQGVQRDR